MPNSLRARWLPLLALLAFLARGLALDGFNSSPYFVDSWGAKEGLPQSSVISLVKSRDGYLWLATLRGVVRFDGVKFTVFDESNTRGLTSSRAVKLFEDSQRNLWIGTET